MKLAPTSQRHINELLHRHFIDIPYYPYPFCLYGHRFNTMTSHFFPIPQRGPFWGIHVEAFRSGFRRSIDDVVDTPAQTWPWCITQVAPQRGDEKTKPPVRHVVGFSGGFYGGFPALGAMLQPVAATPQERKSKLDHFSMRRLTGVASWNFQPAVYIYTIHINIWSIHNKIYTCLYKMSTQLDLEGWQGMA